MKQTKFRVPTPSHTLPPPPPTPHPLPCGVVRKLCSPCSFRSYAKSARLVFGHAVRMSFRPWLGHVAWRGWRHMLPPTPPPFPLPHPTHATEKISGKAMATCHFYWRVPFHSFSPIWSTPRLTSGTLRRRLRCEEGYIWGGSVMVWGGMV